MARSDGAVAPVCSRWCSRVTCAQLTDIVPSFLQLTVVDFVMYELLDQHRIFDASLVDAHDNLGKFLKRFEELEPIKTYMASDRFIKAPLNNKMAKFGAE